MQQQKQQQGLTCTPETEMGTATGVGYGTDGEASRFGGLRHSPKISKSVGGTADGDWERGAVEGARGGALTNRRGGGGGLIVDCDDADCVLSPSERVAAGARHHARHHNHHQSSSSSLYTAATASSVGARGQSLYILQEESDARGGLINHLSADYDLSCGAAVVGADHRDGTAAAGRRGKVVNARTKRSRQRGGERVGASALPPQQARFESSFIYCPLPHDEVEAIFKRIDAAAAAVPTPPPLPTDGASEGSATSADKTIAVAPTDEEKNALESVRRFYHNHHTHTDFYHMAADYRIHQRCALPPRQARFEQNLLNLPLLLSLAGSVTPSAAAMNSTFMSASNSGSGGGDGARKGAGVRSTPRDMPSSMRHAMGRLVDEDEQQGTHGGDDNDANAKSGSHREMMMGSSSSSRGASNFYLRRGGNSSCEISDAAEDYWSRVTRLTRELSVEFPHLQIQVPKY